MKIIASDFDKTFFTDKYLENIKKINDFVLAGNLFIIVTGRNLTHLLKDVSGYNIKYSYIICNDGRTIYDSNLKPIIKYDIEEDIAFKIFNKLKASDAVAPPIIDTSYELRNDFKVPVNAIIARPIDNEKTKKVLEEIMNEYREVSGYISDNWLNLASSKSSKGLALKYLENHLQIHSNNIYTIGDGINDIPMNELYENSYAVLICVPELKKISKNIIADFGSLVDKIMKEK